MAIQLTKPSKSPASAQRTEAEQRCHNDIHDYIRSRLHDTTIKKTSADIEAQAGRIFDQHHPQRLILEQQVSVLAERLEQSRIRLAQLDARMHREPQKLSTANTHVPEDSDHDDQ